MNPEAFPSGVAAATARATSLLGLSYAFGYEVFLVKN